MFWLSNKKNIFPVRTLIWRPGTVIGHTFITNRPDIFVETYVSKKKYAHFIVFKYSLKHICNPIWRTKSHGDNLSLFKDMLSDHLLIICIE